jgi:hypothetical protein
MRYLFLAIFMMWAGVAMMAWTPTVDADIYMSGVTVQ